MRPGRALLALVVVAVLVNLPVVHQAWQRWQLDRQGVDVAAEVTDSDVLREDDDPVYVVRFRLPESVDPEQRTWPADVSRAAYDRAKEAGTIGVRVLPDHPSAQRVEGQHAGVVGFVIVGVVDLLVLLLGLLVWRHRRSGGADDDPAADGPATLDA